MRRAGTLALCIVVAAGAACAPPPEPEAASATDPIADVEPEELFQRAVVLAQAGDYVRAEQYLLEARDRGYPEKKIVPLLMRVCLAASRLRAALSYAQPYLERHPDAWPLRFLVASIQLGLGEPREARRELERVIEQKPDEPEPHFLLAMVLRDSFDDDEAARPHFERYLELAPEGEHVAEVREALRPAGERAGPRRIERSEVPGVEAGSGSEPETETGPEAESGSGSGSEAETETESGSETETETESGSEETQR